MRRGLAEQAPDACPICRGTGVDPLGRRLKSHPEAFRRCQSCNGAGYTGHRYVTRMRRGVKPT